jgi:hypothetical protein
LWQPEKPEVEITLPKELQKGHFTVEDALKVPYWNKRLGDFEKFVEIAKLINITPIVSTERWYVPGVAPLRVRPNKDLFKTSNGPMFWPLTYEQSKQLLRLNSSIISAWAQQNKIKIVDIDGTMPDDPDLYTDGGHDVELAQRLRAWIVFQSMVPLLQEDAKSGKVPRHGQQSGSEHPFIKNPPLRIPRKDLLDFYDEKEKLYINWLQQNDLSVSIDESALRPSNMPLGSLVATDKNAVIDQGSPIVLTTGSLRLGTSAMYPLPSRVMRVGPALIKIGLRVIDGEIGVGLKPKGTASLLQYAVVPKRSNSAYLSFSLESTEDIESIVLTNHQRKDGLTSSVEISSIEILQ